MTSEKVLMVYCDGSARPSNPGFGGYGIFAYLLESAKTASRTKFPIGTKYNLTPEGIRANKLTNPYKTDYFVEYIGVIPSDEATNNLAEVLAFKTALEIALSIEGLTTVNALTDSKYVVDSFNTYLSKWKESNYVRKDRKEISHKNLWIAISNLRDILKSKGTTINLGWVKGHSDEPGNTIADLYSIVGSNSARLQYSKFGKVEQTVLLNKVTDYKDFKDQVSEKDIIYYFRDLYFSNTPHFDDTNYCFLNTSEDETNIGKKDVSTIFAVNVGHVPKLVTEAREVYRRGNRVSSNLSCFKLNLITDNKVLLRLSELVGIENLLILKESATYRKACLVNNTSSVIFDYTPDYPYVVGAGDVFSSSLDVLSRSVKGEEGTSSISVDITDLLVKEGKLVLTNKDKHIDLTNMFDGKYSFINKLILTIGKDIPSYLALCNIAKGISSVKAVLEVNAELNSGSLYTVISLEDRHLCSINITNKYVLMKK